MKLIAFVLKATEIETILLGMKIALEETAARGPPAWFLALQAQEWIEENQAFYPSEEDLPQAGPSIQEYASDPALAD